LTGALGHDCWIFLFLNWHMFCCALPGRAPGILIDFNLWLFLFRVPGGIAGNWWLGVPLSLGCQQVQAAGLVRVVVNPSVTIAANSDE